MNHPTETQQDGQKSHPHSEELIARHIARNPHQTGIASLWLPSYGYSVWILADALNAADHDVAQVAREWEVPVEAVEAVAAFYAKYREAIDAQILVNALDFKTDW